MRAITINAYGEVPAMVEAPLPPSPGPGEVQVAVAAAGLNPVDWKVAAGLFGPTRGFPLILGRDVAGIVTAVGEGVRLEPGDRVSGWATGAYAEHVVTTAALLEKVPDAVDLTAAAAVPTPGVTAYQLSVRASDDGAGKVLIVGATGTVGTFATQLISASGSQVIATASPERAEGMRRLGADDILDHTSGPVVEQLLSLQPSGVDLLIDLVSGPVDFADMTRAVRPGGTALSAIGAARVNEPELTSENFTMTPDARALVLLLGQIGETTLQIVGLKEIPLEKAADALAASREGRSAGKTVLTI